TNNFGCNRNTQTEVILLPCDMDIPIPNAFRPTSNIIENQTFKPVFGPVVPLTYHLQIYNRWGNLVFETRDYRQGWDGRYNGGDAPSGAYVWVLRYTNEGEAAPVEKTLKGTVTLVR
ncbi:MAG TPA: gliding motility-associated C-terminal domain-containing protein, partial [Bacteroidales bacterium]|nr:gliding motility-associated C-terminal domain-containing protein [Bacteroidales bacterium]